MTDAQELDRPTEGDVLDLVLEDHRRFESLLRELRDRSADRDAVRRTFSALHVAHAVAEEQEVYPTLRRQDAIGEHEAEHGQEEHAEGHQALLDVLEAEDLTTDDFDELVEALATAVNHHLTEEELTILNPAREEVTTEVRRRLGAAFAGERNRRLDQGCGSLEELRVIVRTAEDEGLLDRD